MSDLVLTFFLILGLLLSLDTVPSSSQHRTGAAAAALAALLATDVTLSIPTQRTQPALGLVRALAKYIPLLNADSFGSFLLTGSDPVRQMVKDALIVAFSLMLALLVGHRAGQRYAPNRRFNLPRRERRRRHPAVGRAASRPAVDNRHGGPASARRAGHHTHRHGHGRRHFRRGRTATALHRPQTFRPLPALRQDVFVRGHLQFRGLGLGQLRLALNIHPSGEQPVKHRRDRQPDEQ